MNNSKGLEIMIFIVLIMAICILGFPFFEKIFKQSQSSATKSNVYSIIEQVKNLYLKENQKIDNIVYLPFKVEFKEGDYQIYCGDNNVNLETKLIIKGSKPLSGTVIWDENNDITVENLKFKTHTCNKTKTGAVKCTVNSD